MMNGFGTGMGFGGGLGMLLILVLHAWETGSQARVGIGRWITFYNHQRQYTAHGGQPPAVVYFNSIETDQQVQAVA